MSPEKLLDLYNEGGINTVGFVIELLNSITEANVDAVMQRLPDDALPAMKRFLEEYHPMARVYNAHPPLPTQVELARLWVTNNR